MSGKILVRTDGVDVVAMDIREIQDWLDEGKCKLGDPAYVESLEQWHYIAELGAIADLFKERPKQKVEKPIITLINAVKGSKQEGPITLTEMKSRISAGEVCSESWIFIEGDKEWRQVKNVKLLRERLPSLPTEPPEISGARRMPPNAAVVKPSSAPEPIEFSSQNSSTDISTSMPNNFVPSGGVTSLPPTLEAELTQKTDFKNTELEAETKSLSTKIPELPPARAETSASIQIDLDSESMQELKGGVAYDHLDLNTKEVEAKLDTGLPKSNIEEIVTSGGIPTPKDFIENREATTEPEDTGSGSIPGIAPIPERNTSAEEEEDETKAISTLGLSLQQPDPLYESPEPTEPAETLGAQEPVTPPALESTQSAAVPPPSIQTAPPPINARANKMSGAHTSKKELPEDGTTIEVPSGAIWIVKDETDQEQGPFGFLDIIEKIKSHELDKEMKISKVGTNRFCKIKHQYEFNVTYTIDTYSENGQEKQRILIKRRHPRAHYVTQATVIKDGESTTATCINISAGGVLLEVKNLNFELGEVIDLKILPGAIARLIECRALVIGKLPKKPPGLALQFTNLEKDDRTAIEEFVSQALQRGV